MLKLFIHRRHKRPVTHFDAFTEGSSFGCLEVGSLTVEVERKPAKRASCCFFRLGGPVFWTLFAASASLRIFGVINEPVEHLAVSTAWATYLVAQTTIFRS